MEEKKRWKKNKKRLRREECYYSLFLTGHMADLSGSANQRRVKRGGREGDGLEWEG